MMVKVLVLAGGLSHEREVSLHSGQRVANALRDAGCEVRISDVDSSMLTTIRDERPDVVWPVLHGSSGEDGSLRDVLDLVGVPYVGSTSAACRRAFDKPVANAEVAAAGISVPEFYALPHSVFRDLGASEVLARVVHRMGLPLVVKPTRGGSSLGVVKVGTATDLPQAMVGCFAYDDVAMIQRAVSGVEVAVSVLDTGAGPQALPPVEIVPDLGGYDFEARYTPGETEFFCPARLDEQLIAQLASMAVLVHTVLGLRDLSRTDVIVDTSTGTLWFLEVNVAPGMTETSLLPQSVSADGRELPATYRALVDAALAR
jgi:D-alanine-D-alanine ligase